MRRIPGQGLRVLTDMETNETKGNTAMKRKFTLI